MAEPPLLIQRQGALATLTLDRAATRNVLDMDMDIALRAAMDQVTDRRRRELKRMINESIEHSLADQLQAEEREFPASSLTDDFAEGVRAFVGKRAPDFRGC